MRAINVALRTRATGSALALAAMAGLVATSGSHADVGQSTAFYVNITNTKLLPILTARVGSPEYTYNVRARGYFKVGRTSVAKLAPFSVVASPIPHRIQIAVPRSVRLGVGRAVRKAHGHRVTLTLVTSGASTGTPVHTDHFSRDFFLRVR